MKIINKLDLLDQKISQKIFPSKVSDFGVMFVKLISDSLMFFYLPLTIFVLYLKTCFYHTLTVLSVLGLLWITSKYIIKPLINRKRPDTKGHAYLVIKVQYSMPSTHTIGATMLGIICSLCCPEYTLVFIVYSLIIAFSRLYFRVHFLGDILAGILIALLTLPLFSILI